MIDTSIIQLKWSVNRWGNSWRTYSRL